MIKNYQYHEMKSVGILIRHRPTSEALALPIQVDGNEKSPRLYMQTLYPDFFRVRIDRYYIHTGIYRCYSLDLD